MTIVRLSSSGFVHLQWRRISNPFVRGRSRSSTIASTVSFISIDIASSPSPASNASKPSRLAIAANNDSVAWSSSTMRILKETDITRFAGNATNHTRFSRDAKIARVSGSRVRSDASGPLLFRQHQLAPEELLQKFQRSGPPEDVAGIPGDDRELAVLEMPQSLLNEPRDAREENQDRIRLLRFVVRADFRQPAIERFSRRRPHHQYVQQHVRPRRPQRGVVLVDLLDVESLGDHLLLERGIRDHAQ